MKVCVTDCFGDGPDREQTENEEFVLIFFIIFVLLVNTKKYLLDLLSRSDIKP